MKILKETIDNWMAAQRKHLEAGSRLTKLDVFWIKHYAAKN